MAVCAAAAFACAYGREKGWRIRVGRIDEKIKEETGREGERSSTYGRGSGRAEEAPGARASPTTTHEAVVADGPLPSGAIPLATVADRGAPCGALSCSIWPPPPSEEEHPCLSFFLMRGGEGRGAGGVVREGLGEVGGGGDVV